MWNNPPPVGSTEGKETRGCKLSIYIRTCHRHGHSVCHWGRGCCGCGHRSRAVSVWALSCVAATAFVVVVTDLQGPPLECTQTEKLQDLKKLTQQYTCDRGSCDDVQISYLETLEDRDNDNLRLAQMLAG
jgi:hypothetical protein